MLLTWVAGKALLLRMSRRINLTLYPVDNWTGSNFLWFLLSPRWLLEIRAACRITTLQTTLVGYIYRIRKWPVCRWCGSAAGCRYADRWKQIHFQSLSLALQKHRRPRRPTNSTYLYLYQPLHFWCCAFILQKAVDTTVLLPHQLAMVSDDNSAREWVRWRNRQ